MGPAEGARREQQVVEIESYLRETIAEIDEAIAQLQAKRSGLAVRMAALNASHDPVLQRAADDYASRVAEGRPYEDAEDANSLIMEAHRRFVP